GPPPCAGCAGPGSARPRSPAHAPPLPGGPAPVRGRLRSAVLRLRRAILPPSGLPRRCGARLGHQRAPLGLTQPRLPSGTRPVTQPVEPRGVEALQPFADGLRVTPPSRRDGPRPQAVPAAGEGHRGGTAVSPGDRPRTA